MLEVKVFSDGCWYVFDVYLIAADRGVCFLYVHLRDNDHRFIIRRINAHNNVWRFFFIYKNELKKWVNCVNILIFYLSEVLFQEK